MQEPCVVPDASTELEDVGSDDDNDVETSELASTPAELTEGRDR